MVINLTLFTINVTQNDEGASTVLNCIEFLNSYSAGPDNSLLYTINTLHSIRKKIEAEELHNLCERGKLKMGLSHMLKLMVSYSY